MHSCTCYVDSCTCYVGPLLNSNTALRVSLPAATHVASWFHGVEKLADALIDQSGVISSLLYTLRCALCCVRYAVCSGLCLLQGKTCRCLGRPFYADIFAAVHAVLCVYAVLCSVRYAVLCCVRCAASATRGGVKRQAGEPYTCSSSNVHMADSVVRIAGRRLVCQLAPPGPLMSSGERQQEVPAHGTKHRQFTDRSIHSISLVNQHSNVYVLRPVKRTLWKIP